MTQSFSARRGALCSGVILCSLSCNVFASGFALLEQSASRLGTAFSGTAAAADDPSTIFYNPAGLAKLDSAELSIVGSAVNVSSEFSNVSSQAALGQPLGNEGGDAGGWNPLASVYYAQPINDRLAFGFAFNVPFGLKLEYDDPWMGRFQARKSEIKTYNFNPALSWRVNERFVVGAGLNYQRLQAELTNAVNYMAVVGQGLQQLVAAGQLSPAAVPALLAANAGLEGETRVRGDDSASGYNIGILIELAPQTRLGLGYRSAVDYDIEGSARFAPPTATNPTGAAIIAAATAGPLASGRVSVDLKLPEIATASFYHGIGRLELMGDVAWTGWSSVQELRIVRDSGSVLSVTPERWEDTWRFALGAAYRVNDNWKLRGGVAYDETPVPAETRTARLPDAQRRWVAIGAEWKASEAVTVDVGYARLFSSDVTLNQNDGSTAASGLLAGQQASGVDIVSVQAGYRF